MRLRVFPRPTRVSVFLRHFMRITRPVFRNFTLLNRLILVSRISLTRRVDKRRVYDRSGMRDQTFGFKLAIKLLKKNFYHTLLRQGIFEKPDRLRVWNSSAKRKTEETLKAYAICDLILCLLIRKIEKTFKNQYLEHENHVVGRTTGGAFALFTQSFHQNWTKYLKIDDIQFFERISELGKPQSLRFFAKKIGLHCEFLR